MLIRICVGYLLLSMMAVFFSGCRIPVFEHPLIKPEAATAPDELKGYWVSGEDEFDYLVSRVGKPAPDGMLKIDIVSKNPDYQRQPGQAERLIGFVTPIKDMWILHVVINQQETDNGWFAGTWDKDNIGAYLLVGLKLKGDQLTLLTLDDTFLEKAVTEKKLAAVIGNQPQAARSDQPGNHQAQASDQQQEKKAESGEEDAVQQFGFFITSDAKTLSAFFEANIDKGLFIADQESALTKKKQ